MAPRTLEQDRNPVDIDYEALAEGCLKAGTAGFKSWETFDADLSWRIAHGNYPTL
jgi:hypothetical protein